MDLIQDGVYFRSGESPPEHFSIVFLEAIEGASLSDIYSLLVKIWDTLRLLKEGQIANLPGQTFPPGDLQYLIGYGSSLFNDPSISHLKPPELKRFRRPRQSGGGAISLGSGIHFENSISQNSGSSEIAIQITGNTALTVRRAIVEIWKIIEFHANETSQAVLNMVDSYTGFGREDNRSWIDFFDGTSNLRSSERIDAIEIKERSQHSEDKWKEKGTYLCYMRLQVSIADWIKLTRDQQELLVGRDKLTGCALISDGEGCIPVSGCPVVGTHNVGNPGNREFISAPRPPFNRDLSNSHIHRVNQGRATPADPESRLIYRQGYEFFEGVNESGKPILGLNFVSFQDTPERILGMLKLPGWLGGVNFGGDENEQLPGMSNLIRAHSAGFFIVPPKDENELPGKSLFT